MHVRNLVCVSLVPFEVQNQILIRRAACYRSSYRFIISDVSVVNVDLMCQPGLLDFLSGVSLALGVDCKPYGF